MPARWEGMDHVKGALRPLLPKVIEILKLVECKIQIEHLESLKRELVSLKSKLELLQEEEFYNDAELGMSQHQVEEVRASWCDLYDLVHNFLVCLKGSEPIPDIDMKRLVQKMDDLHSAKRIPMDVMIEDRSVSTTTIEDVKGALRALFLKVVDLLNLVKGKMQIDLNKEVHPLESLKGQLESLQSKLEFLRKEEVYIDAELRKSPSSGTQVKVWEQVRELTYDVEDVLDSFHVCLESSETFHDIDKLKQLVQKMTNLYPSEKIPTKDLRANAMIEHVVAIDPSVQAMYSEIPDLKCMSVNMDGLKKMISGDEVAMVKSEHMETEVPAGTSEYVPSNDPWPIQVDDLQCEDRNMPSRNKPKIACVVGIGGLGKTTLVRALYDEMKKNFSCDAFVSVGQNANEKKVLTDILLSLEKEKEMEERKHTVSRLEKFDVMRLLKELEGFLCKKRYLIVIDDIWKEKLWKLIECAFQNECHLGSQVFTTTCSVNVAEACCSSSDGRLIYQMKPLSFKESKRLFYRRLFSQEVRQCPDDFKQVSAEILKKCGGVPLAIITVASLLASNGEGMKPIEEWNHLLKSIGRGLTGGDSVEEMNRLLYLSYDDLPPELKNCLLYTTVFTEDRIIKKDHLVSMWIAEGFVQRTYPEDSLFAIAENYFNMLINRSMIEPVKIDGEGTAKACRIHDMVLGFLCSLSTEANFVTIVDGGNRTASNFETKIRRLSIQDRMTTEKLFTAKLSTASMGMAHVRSLIVSSSTVIDDMVPPLSAYQALRVLDLTDCNVERTLNIHLHVINLLHVRYLGLRRAHFTILPADVGKLRFLQILDLRNTFMKKLPSSIVELRELIYLRVYPETRLPDEFGELTSLEKLTHLQVNQGSAYVAKQLGYLTKLRVLRISPCGMDGSLAKEFVESLNKMQEIRILEFKFRYVYEIPDGTNECIRYMEGSWKPSSHLQKFHASSYHHFNVLPKWITGSNISSLSIWMKKVRREDIEILGMLNNLRYISLTGLNKFPEKIEEGFQFENDVFPVAIEWRIGGIMTLPSMFPNGAMPKVQTLQFDIQLDELSNMDLKMGHLPALKHVEVVIWKNMNKYSYDFIIRMKEVAYSHPNLSSITYETQEYLPVSDETNDDEEVVKKQLPSSDMEAVDEAVDVQASHAHLPLTEIDEPSGLVSKPAVLESPILLQLLDPAPTSKPGVGKRPALLQLLDPALANSEEQILEAAAPSNPGVRWPVLLQLLDPARANSEEQSPKTATTSKPGVEKRPVLLQLLDPALANSEEQILEAATPSKPAVRWPVLLQLLDPAPANSEEQSPETTTPSKPAVLESPVLLQLLDPAPVNNEEQSSETAAMPRKRQRFSAADTCKDHSS